MYLPTLRSTGFALRCSMSPRQEESQKNDIYQRVKKILRFLLTPRKSPGKQASCARGRWMMAAQRAREARGPGKQRPRKGHVPGRSCSGLGGGSGSLLIPQALCVIGSRTEAEDSEERRRMTE